MVSGTGDDGWWNAIKLSPAPITGFAHKAGVKGDARVCTVLTALDMATKLRGATDLDRGHDAPLPETDVSFVGSAPGNAEAAEDIRHFQPGTRHRRPIRSAARAYPIDLVASEAPTQKKWDSVDIAISRRGTDGKIDEEASGFMLIQPCHNDVRFGNGSARLPWHHQ